MAARILKPQVPGETPAPEDAEPVATGQAEAGADPTAESMSQLNADGIATVEAAPPEDAEPVAVDGPVRVDSQPAPVLTEAGWVVPEPLPKA